MLHLGIATSPPPPQCLRTGCRATQSDTIYSQRWLCLQQWDHTCLDTLWHTDQNPGIWTWSCTWGGQPLTSLRAEVGGFVGGMLALDAVLSTSGEPISARCCVGALIDNMALISHIQTW